ncbi:MAG: SH3 domain-containing protein [Lachnospiraceae bacterium]|jgi:spore germination cell wall hydrolase CwlJ-like protein|nr:SH3 domain-containing protein [Lachnospiraceae bacterium]
MKFDKKVMESGVVAAFSLVLAFSALPAAGGSTEADLNSRNVELIAETAGKSYRNVVATKVKKQNQLVASSVEEKQPVELKLEEAVKEKQPAELKLEQAMKEQPEQAKLEEAAKEEQPENAVQDIIEEEKQPEESMPEEKEEKAADSKKEEVAEDKDNKSKDKDAEEKKEVSPWDTKLMPQVEEYLNVRTQASEEAEPAGKLPKGASAEIVESGDEWTKIKSGSVEGYVKNEYCVTGQEAETLANELGTTYATAVTGGVRVRETASSEEGVTILDVLEEGGKIKVDKEAEAVDGWVCVKVGDAAGYVSAEYVNVELELGKAISVEEERAAIEAAEAERRAKEAAQSQSQGGGTQQKAAVAASYDDVTLLGALIQCEAGSECYEGQLAVGAVVMNRVRAGYAGSISGVIYQSGQFTPALNGTMAGVLASGVSGSCIQAAQQAISGVDNVNGATSFRSVSSGMQGIVIGNHVFF